MNRLAFVLALCGIVVATVAASQAAHAQSALSETHIEHIRQNCVTAQTTLTRLHASDALLRVNRGKLYERFSNKLMAPLNSRIALSRLGGLKLAAITLEYDRQIDVFRSSYSDYEQSMSRTIDIDCVDKPTEFYESVRATREKRERLHNDTETLTTLLEAYQTEFESFAKEFEEVTK